MTKKHRSNININNRIICTLQVCIREMKNTYKILVENFKGIGSL